MNTPQHVTVGASMASGGVAGALVTIIAWGMSLCHVTMPPEVAAALATILTAGSVYVSRFVPGAAEPSAPASDLRSKPN